MKRVASLRRPAAGRAWGCISALLACALAVAAPARASAAASATTARAPYAGSVRALIAERNLSAALTRLRSEAEAGDRDSRYLLGMMLLNGVGIPPDASQARSWLQRAAEQDQASAAFVLAWLTGQDTGGAAQSRQWLERSARLGDPRAIEGLRDPDGLLHAVQPVAGDAATRAALALHAARHDDAELLAKLGAIAATASDEFGQGALAQAVDAGAVHAGAWLLDHGANVQAADARGITALMRAAARPEGELLPALIAHGANVNAVDAERRTALMFAARQDRLQNLERLRTAGADVTARDGREYNALDIALLSGATRTAATLRDAGLKPSVAHGAPARSGLFDGAHPGELYRDWPPAALATARNDVNTLRQLLDAGVSPGLRLSQGDTLLHVAFHAQAEDSLALLLARGADAAVADRRGRSVLGLAAESATRIDVLDALLKARIAADGHAPGEVAPLITALRAGNIAAATRLLDAGASPDVRDAEGRPALTVATLGAEPALLPLLLQQKVNVNARDARGHGALWAAVAAGNAERIRLLLAAGAQPDVADEQGLTPLAVAATGGRLEIVEQLLRAHASPSHADRHGDTPLHAAAAAGQSAVVAALLRVAATPDTINERGDTALIAASRGGHTETCKVLLAAGTKTSLRNKDRQTAADVARNRGFAPLADLIEKKT